MNRRRLNRVIALLVLVLAAALIFSKRSVPPAAVTTADVATVLPVTASDQPAVAVPIAVVHPLAVTAASAKAPVTVARQHASDPAIAQFQDWQERFLAASPAERAAMEDEGVRLATARRSAFKQLIISNPREALRQAVPMVVRQELPASILSLTEERLNGVGALRVYQGVPLEGEPRPAKSLTFRQAEFKDGKTYRAYVYGRREPTLTWTAGALLNGVALDADFAVNEDPMRRLEVGEVPSAAKPAVTLCPVSGNTTAGGDLKPGESISDATPAVETATEIVYFCGGAHIDHYNQTLILGEGVSGGAFGFTGILPAAPTPALGIVKVLAIPMTYADQNTVPATEATLYATLRDVGDFYAKASFGRLTLVSAVTPPVKLPHNEAWYVNRDTSNGGDIDGEGLEHNHARNEARKLGYDSTDYDCVVVRHTGGPGSYGGLGGGSSVWARSDSASLWAHEIGHCFALAHANFWDTAGTSAIGAGANQEYGDSYDNMGGAPFPAGQYNAQAKSQVKWMPSNFVQNVSQSGQYRIYAMDQGVLIPSRAFAMTIVKDAQKTYWGEVRSLFDSNPWVKNGILLGWRYPGGSGNNLQLIDTTPGSPFLKEDAPVSLGNTFSDFESGIHITTVALSDTPRYIDVVVNFGQFPTNQRPSLSLAASADVVAVGATVTFTATASDPDGDPPAYAWQNFGDTTVKIVSPNSPVITRAFTNAGTYVVTCTVSDMKGGTTTRNQLITVGSGNSRSTISGRVTLLGLGLQDVVITANGANGIVTDADGYFTIPNLTNNTYTMTPLLYGYAFDELFNNSVTVGPNFAGANFEATAQPIVTISATISNANELSPVTAGRFTITRTGDISQDLVVNVNTALGSATKTTDYTFTPNYVPASQGFSNFTILADSAALDIEVTPVVDAAQEGPETVILQLGPGIGYLVGSQSTATVVINDDDTSLPKVSIAATTLNTIENSGLPAVFTFSRTGATTSNLTVNFTIGGTATNGTDYVALSNNVVILAGSVSSVVNVVPVDDSLSEYLETVKLTLSNNAAYLIDPLASNATVNIIDDDLQTVTVVATDPNAREVDLTQPGAVADTGTFVVMRSGETSKPLTIYYAMAGTPGSGVTALHGVDYEVLPGVLVIPAGVSNASVTILPRFDTIGEGPESVVLSLGAGSTAYVLGSPSSATVTISDAVGSVPTLDVVNTTSSAAEPSTSGNFRITARGGTNAGSLTFYYTISGTATAGVDYTITGLDTNTLVGSNTITLSNGATVTKDITVTPINDALLEDLESITLTLNQSNSFTLFPSTTSATMWMRDNDQPTVYVDTQVGTGSSSTVTEGTVSSPTKFYISRTGSTASALDVNFTLGGTATAGADYSVTTSATLTFTNATSNGVLTIPAGFLGADLPLVITNDTSFEGTETITLGFAPGSYARSAGTVMYLADNDVATVTAAFPSPSSSGSESNTIVNLPVTLTATSAVPVTVEYLVNSSTAGSSSSVAVQTLPYWVRVVRTGFSMTFFESTDGATWVQRGGPTTVANLPTNSYYAGLVVASGSATTNIATIDSFSITGLVPGGTTGAENAVNLGNASGGNSTVVSGVYSFTNAGNGVLSASTSDNFRFVYLPVMNSSNCSVTARLVSLGANVANARVGVMMRADVANQGAIYAATMANGTGGFIAANRGILNGTSSTQTPVTTTILPIWFKLERTNDLFRTYSSKDGTNWVPLGNTNQTIALGPTVIAGVAVSAKSDGNIVTGTFDNVSITPSPAGTLQGREVGFVNVDGSENFSSGVWTVNGSGNGIGGSNDEGHLLATEVSGDFTLIARLVSLSGGAAAAQAGVMVRQDRTHYSRGMYAGFVNSGSTEQQYRVQSATTAFGSGVDFTLAPGVLTFAPGETNKNITFSINDDNVREPNNLITVQLTNANGAAVSSTANFHGYTIVDNDGVSGVPLVGFATASNSVSENAGTVTVQVSLGTPAPGAASVDFTTVDGTALNGADYTATNGTLSFAVGESIKTIVVPILDDAAIEPAKTFTLILANPAGLAFSSLSTNTVTITDDDLPVVTMVANDANAAEAGLDLGQFTVTRTGPTTNTLSVVLARSGSAGSGTDYAAITNPLNLSIAIGASNATVNVTPIQDASNEANETVILTITTNAAYTVGSQSNATVTIADDDRSTVSMVANDSTASETAGNPGQFSVTRTLPTNGTLTVNLTVSGTAINGTDYTNVAATVAFAAGEASKVINIFPIDDSATEGDEQVTISIASGSYTIGAAYYDNVTILDNDNPPTLFISSPSAQGPLIANSNGLIVAATVTDDGAPQPVTLQWSQVGGPGIATFETPAAASTAVTFSTNGTYVLRITATDGQFTVNDQVAVVVGSVIGAAEWVTQDMAPSSARRGQGLVQGGVFTVSGTGAGYAGATADTAHVMVRQTEGDASIVARLNSLTNASAPLAGVTIRSSLQRGANRAVLGYVPGIGLQFRTRTTINTADTTVTNAGVTLPVWLKLERIAATDDVIASFAVDVAGAPGAWTLVGSNTFTMDTRVNVGLTTTANTNTSTATAVFDNVTLTPAVNGPALLAEEASLTPTEAGSFAESNGVYTIAGSASGIFYGWQFQGDVMVTVKHAGATSGAGSAKSGIRIRETMDSGAYVQVGRIPTGSYNGYFWQSIAGGGTGGVPSFTGTNRWIRLIRRGNSVTAFHAPDVSGAPGTWAQIGQPRTVIMTTPMVIGFNVDNASGVGLNTVTFSNLSIVPLNKAPIVDAGIVAASVISSNALNATVTDDNFPAPPELTTLWSSVSGPAPAVFGNATNADTTATFSADGAYRLRLQASDGSAETFNDLSVLAFTSAYAAWQGTQFSGGSSNADAVAGGDPDFDGLINLFEYAFGTSPTVANLSPVLMDIETIGSDRFLRLTLPKNPAATDLLFEVQAITDLTSPATWSASGLVIETNNATQLRVRDFMPLDPDSVQRFMRVKVSR